MLIYLEGMLCISLYEENISGSLSDMSVTTQNISFIYHCKIYIREALSLYFQAWIVLSGTITA